MKNLINKTLKEYSALLITIALFFTIPTILRWIDPTTASFDPGVLHTVFAALVMYAIYQAVTWSITKNIWPGVGNYMRSGNFSTDFERMKPQSKVLVSLGIYFIILLSFILITIAIL